MYSKLALRNVKRETSNYIIYFITVAITVSLMFAITNVIANPLMMERAEDSSSLKIILFAICILVAIVVSFVLSYASSFMLGLRKQEFGTYLTLGMNRKGITKIFLMETLILGLVALITGILFGLLVYQVIMAVAMNIMDMEITFSPYYPKALFLTIALVCAIFLISSITSVIRLKKSKIYSLLYDHKRVQGKIQKLGLWFAITLVSLLIIIVSCIFIYNTFDKMLTGDDKLGMPILTVSIIICIISVFFFHLGASKCLLDTLLKNRKLKSRGTNTFTLRQLSSKASTNSVMIALLSLLLTVSVIGANLSFMQKSTEDAILAKDYAYDVQRSIFSSDQGAYGPSKISEEEGEKIISSYSKITSKLSYNLYTSGKDELVKNASWSEYADDVYISISDFNKILSSLNQQKVKVPENGFMVLSDSAEIDENVLKGKTLNLSGKTYTFDSFNRNLYGLPYVYIVIVVSDEAARSLSIYSKNTAYSLEKEDYDGISLREDLSYTLDSSDGYTIKTCDYAIKQYTRMVNSQMNAILIIGALFMTITFAFLAMAILAIKIMSSVAEDKRKYNMLNKLGVSNLSLRKTLFKQIGIFFLFPFLLPLLGSIPCGLMFHNIVEKSGLTAQIPYPSLIVLAIALVMILIYLIYFTATYITAKKNILD